jgi:hypothetical protein
VDTAWCRQSAADAALARVWPRRISFGTDRAPFPAGIPSGWHPGGKTQTRHPVLSGEAFVNKRTIWLGVLTTCGLLTVLLCIIVIPSWLYPPLSAADLHGVLNGQARIQLQQAQSQLANDTRSSILQALGGLLLVAGATATWRQVHISREGQITDRFTRAVDQLGSENLDVRIGGIYALERIAKNSPDDRSTIQYILGAFVRNHASWPVGAPGGPQHPTPTVDEELPWLSARAPDIHAAAGILTRRLPSPDARRLLLSRVDLRGFQIHEAQLAGTEIRHTNLARAWLRRARLDRADLRDTDLRGANLEGSHLNSANLSGAYLQGANLYQADLSYADLCGTDLSDANLDGAVLTGAQADKATVWPVEVDARRRNELGIIETNRDGPAQIPTVRT